MPRNIAPYGRYGPPSTKKRSFFPRKIRLGRLQNGPRHGSLRLRKTGADNVDSPVPPLWPCCGTADARRHNEQRPSPSRGNGLCSIGSFLLLHAVQPSAACMASASRKTRGRDSSQQPCRRQWPVFSAHHGLSAPSVASGPGDHSGSAPAHREVAAGEGEARRSAGVFFGRQLAVG